MVDVAVSKALNALSGQGQYDTGLISTRTEHELLRSLRHAAGAQQRTVTRGMQEQYQVLWSVLETAFSGIDCLAPVSVALSLNRSLNPLASTLRMEVEVICFEVNKA